MKMTLRDEIEAFARNNNIVLGSIKVSIDGKTVQVQIRSSKACPGPRSGVIYEFDNKMTYEHIDGVFKCIKESLS